MIRIFYRLVKNLKCRLVDGWVVLALLCLLNKRVHILYLLLLLNRFDRFVYILRKLRVLRNHRGLPLVLVLIFKFQNSLGLCLPPDLFLVVIIMILNLFHGVSPLLNGVIIEYRILVIPYLDVSAVLPNLIYAFGKLVRDFLIPLINSFYI